jgi:hypothetical protein
VKKKPVGPKYRNLTAFGGIIYYQRVVGGKRIRFSCKTEIGSRPWRPRGSMRSARASGVRTS